MRREIFRAMKRFREMSRLKVLAAAMTYIIIVSLCSVDMYAYGLSAVSRDSVSVVGEGVIKLSSSARSRVVKDHVSILTKSGVRYNFYVEIADTPQKRRTGLMYRQQLASWGGMLIVYESSTKGAGIWMKNTLIPLDILFINSKGVITKIVRRAIPQSTNVHTSAQSKAILEINGGSVDRLAIKEGDTIIHKIFGNH